MTDIFLNSEHGVTIAKRRTSEQLLQDSGPYASLLRDLMQAAKSRGASDVHIEPHEQGVDLRLRIDGNLMLEKTVDVGHRESLILETKRIFGLSIGISGRPQDGRSSFPSLRLDVRVSLLPTHFGEKIVMRLLNLDASFALEQLGFLKDEQEVLERATRFDNGVVIVSGPTGSGKTRTLYSLLNKIDPRRHNIVTLEDPIEYRIDGLNQVQVSEKMTFASALRAVLRQDPDVILVGEIRDSETAKLCFQAAETGHLVFSTLHANGALEVIDRLRGLGVDDFALQSNLRLSIAQRLEQTICRECSVAVPEDYILNTYREELKEYPLDRRINAFQKSEECWKCPHCNDGVSGRAPILEYASYTDPEETGEKKELFLYRSLEESRMVRMFQGDVACEDSGYDPNENSGEVTYVE
ncbi:MAG: GspE/PulE family protein [Pseudobdellovibrionaceae bacterium]